MRITRWGTAVTAVFACIATGSAATHYVDLNSPNPRPPFTNWVMAATNIQEAVDVAVAGDEVLVTNGLYATGGRTVGTNVPANRVTVDKAISVRSVNGNEFTFIRGEILRYQGAASIRCVYLAAGASLTGFTLTNGSVPPSEMYGGGVFCESTSAVVNSCLIVSNFSFNGGGGAFSGTLNNCSISHNLSYVGPGGGTLFSTVSNCVLSANLAYNTALYGAPMTGGGACGGSLTHCMLISNAATFRGGGAISNVLNDCVLIGNSSGYSGGGISDSTAGNSTFMGNSSSNGGGVDNSTVVNCTLMQNTATEDGGGAYISTLMNCAVLGNSAVGQSGTFGFGGGVYMTRLYNSRVIGNSGLQGGGAASGGLLANCELSGNTAIIGGGASGAVAMENCTVAGNTATDSGGGTSGCNLANCIVYFNSASSNANYDSGTLSYCCTVPLPGGSGNFTNDPSFIDFYGGNLRLQTNSPCINAGDNTQVVGTTDLDGRPRIVGGTVDLGAYEFQGPGIGEFTAWLQSYGLPTDGSADYLDSDGDGMNNWQEWICGTDPTNAQSVLKMLPPIESAGNLLVSWESVAGKVYALERSTNLGAVAPFSVLQSNIVGQAGTTGYSDTNSSGNGPNFYRVSVQR